MFPCGTKRSHNFFGFLTRAEIGAALTITSMNIELTFQDFVKLAANGKPEKNGATVTFDRPVFPQITIDPKANTGKVVFQLDEADDRRFAFFGECTHQIQSAVFTESGEATDEFEFVVCQRRVKIPPGPTLASFNRELSGSLRSS